MVNFLGTLYNKCLCLICDHCKLPLSLCVWKDLFIKLMSSAPAPSGNSPYKSTSTLSYEIKYIIKLHMPTTHNHAPYVYFCPLNPLKLLQITTDGEET